MTYDRSLDGTYAGTLADFEPEPPYYQTPDGKVTLHHGHVLDVLREMPAESVNCCVTSPPYWSLRRYDCPDQSWGDWVGQHGLEETPELYVEHTMMWLREVRRVLRKDGTLWLNIGDGYASSPAKGGSGPGAKEGYHGGYGRPFRPGSGRADGVVDSRGQRNRDGTPCPPGLKVKDAVLMPFRVALAAQAEGFWVRSVIIWAKPNPMPESVRDRPTDAHEYIFLLTRSKNYWYDTDAIREPHAEPERGMGEIERAGEYQPNTLGMVGAEGVRRWVPAVREYNPAGRNCRSVWTFPTEPFPDAHFAVFPRELPERCIKAGAPVDGVVLDPFVGSGTTCEVAYHLGRNAIGIDASAKYLDMAIERVKQGVLL